MTTIALPIIAILAYCLWRSRCHIALLQRSCDTEQRRGDYWHSETERKQALINEYLECADLMNDCNVELERRNLWLESRRYVILRFWWKRQSQYRQVITWQVRKQ